MPMLTYCHQGGGKPGQFRLSYGLQSVPLGFLSLTGITDERYVGPSRRKNSTQCFATV